jgi:carbamate kinase
MRRLVTQAQWSFARDVHGYRRTVPSPEPIRIIEIDAIKLLVRAKMAVVCAGGGGIPVIADANGLHGVEAVIDKDHTSALLAEELGADALLLLTDVPAVWSKWPMSEGEPIRLMSTERLKEHRFDPGSMGPKVEAACRFADRTGRFVAIGAIEDAEAILDGRAGTIIEAKSR